MSIDNDYNDNLAYTRLLLLGDIGMFDNIYHFIHPSYDRKRIHWSVI
ncbi:hypothetical protein P3K77_13290 [Bacillus cytotoxicus]